MLEMISDYAILIPPVGLTVFGLGYWAIHGRTQRPKEDPAHKGCSTFYSNLFSAGSEFLEATIIVHDRDMDKNPFLLVQVDGHDDVVIPFDSILLLNVTDETLNPNRPMSAFGLTYQDFSGEGTVLFIQTGTDHAITQIQYESIKESYDTWAAVRGTAPLKMEKDVYRKASLVRRPA